MFGDRMCSSYIRELEEWLSMFTYDYEIAEVTKVLNAPYIYKVKVIEFSPDCSYENSYRYDLFITTSGDIKNEDGDSVLNAEANNCAGDITILEFIRNFRVKWFGEEKNNMDNTNVTDRKVTRQQFLDAYNKELDILFNEVEEISEKAHIYGYPVTVHWNGMYCDCADGATPSNFIIPAIADCESELDDEDDINVKENDMEKAKTNEAEMEIENFIDALDIFQKAFENLADYTGSYYIKDEWWDGRDNYPFNWSFEEMPGIIEVWVEGVKDNVRKANEPVIKYETNYSEEADRTFIMKCTYKGNDCIREECVGFYSGEPDEANKTENFIGDLVAEYSWD